MDVHQKITFEYDAGMAFDFTTDGTVYAETQQGVIQNDTLYYPNNLDVHLITSKNIIQTIK